jgi:LacI family transcriptional regulator
VVTLKDVAIRAGVSIATASRVINGNDNVTESSRQRVLDAIKELGYYSNEVARGLRQESMRIIAVTLPSIGNLFFAELLQGIDDVTSTSGYTVLFNDTTENDELELQSLRNIRSLGIAGSIVYHLDALGSDLLNICDNNVPCIIINGRKQEGIRRISFLTYGIEALFTLAVRYLAQFPITDVWFLSPLYKGDIYLSESMIVSCPFKLHWLLTNGSPRDARRVCDQHAVKGGGNAFITVNDFQALGVLNYLQEHGETAHIVSYGDTALAQNLHPAITSVGPSGYQVGVVAARMVLARIEGRAPEASLEGLMEPDIIQRET